MFRTDLRKQGWGPWAVAEDPTSVAVIGVRRKLHLQCSLQLHHHRRRDDHDRDSRRRHSACM